MNDCVILARETGNPADVTRLRSSNTATTNASSQKTGRHPTHHVHVVVPGQTRRQWRQSHIRPNSSAHPTASVAPFPTGHGAGLSSPPTHPRQLWHPRHRNTKTMKKSVMPYPPKRKRAQRHQRRLHPLALPPHHRPHASAPPSPAAAATRFVWSAVATAAADAASLSGTVPGPCAVADADTAEIQGNSFIRTIPVVSYNLFCFRSM